MTQTNSSAPPLPETSPEPPIVIELCQTDKTRSGYFRPQARLKLTPALRTSGLLLALPGEDLKNFLFLLSFVNPNGDCMPTVTELATAMRVSGMKARTRMRRLADFRWQGESLACFLSRGSGLDAYAPNPKLIAYEHTVERVPEPPLPPIKAAGREAVIAYSRARYAHPRAEVERLIAEQNGWPLPEDNAAGHEAAPSAVKSEAESQNTHLAAKTPVAATAPPQESERSKVRRQLRGLGLSGEHADDLLSKYDLLRIQRQLQWLPYRQTRNRAGFLIAAVADNYEAPLALRQSIGGASAKPPPEPALASAESAAAVPADSNSPLETSDSSASDL